MNSTQRFTPVLTYPGLEAPNTIGSFSLAAANLYILSVSDPKKAVGFPFDFAFLIFNF